MKKISFLLIAFLFFQFAQAQDTILKINGEQIIAKIMEVSPIEIKYKKFNFLDGPTYIENKSEIKFIIYSNGVKEEFKETSKPKISTGNAEPQADYYGGRPVSQSYKIDVIGNRYRYNGKKINDRQINDLLLKSGDKQVIQLVKESKHARSMKYIGFAAFPLGIGALVAFGTSFNTDIYGNITSTNSGLLAASAILACGAIACPIASGAYNRKRKQFTKQAVNLYNQKF